MDQSYNQSPLLYPQNRLKRSHDDTLLNSSANDQCVKPSQLTHSQNPHKRVKKSHDAAYITPNMGLGPCDNRQEGLDPTTITPRLGGSYTQPLPYAPFSGQEGLGDGTPWIPSGQSRQTRTSEPVTVNPHGTHGVQTQFYSPPRHQLPYGNPAESVAPPDVMQSNAFFHNAHHFNLGGNPHFTNNVTNVFEGIADGFEVLGGSVSFNALRDSSAQDPTRQCHPGTRLNVLKRLRDWADNPNPNDRVFWLYGPAGAGKSTIAQTFAHFDRKGEVAATFFFFNSDPSRNNGNQLFTTIAWQLALSIPGAKDHIANSLRQCPHLLKSNVETQFDLLVAQPSLLALSVVASQHVAPVIIIDGVDECVDESLQRRFLKVIGDATARDGFPLRFLIVSRPEHHIEQTIRRFRNPFLSIDLATLDDANADVEKYLTDEFSRIASEQGFDPTWPGPEVIRDIVFKSSGNFIYAFVVIEFVGDSYCYAKSQLDIVLNIKPPKSTSPFAVLDQLFVEILRRVPEQDFLKRYLILLNARISVPYEKTLYEDDAVLMHVSEEELHANLRRMRSLLLIGPRIDIHHRSFLDFLHDSSRSAHYYTCAPPEDGEMQGYLKVVANSLVRYVSTMIEQPYRHDGPHFSPRFRTMTKHFPCRIDDIRMPVSLWKNAIQPLLDLQDRLLHLSNFPSSWYLRCDKCTVFQLLWELIYIGLYPEFFLKSPRYWSRCSLSSPKSKTEETNDDDLDSLLLSLLTHLPERLDGGWSPNDEVINFMITILRHNSAEIARRVRLVSNAQKLVDFLYYIIDEKKTFTLSRIGPDAMARATQLALRIFSRVPVLPLAFSFKTAYKQQRGSTYDYDSIPLLILAQTIFASSFLNRHYIVPVFGVHSGRDFDTLSGDIQNGDLSMAEWRQRINPSPVLVTQVLLGLAKALQYIHSMDVVLYHGLDSCDVFLDSTLRPRILSLCSTSPFLLDKKSKAHFNREDNIFSFGCLSYELFVGINVKPLLPIREKRKIIINRPSTPEVADHAWQLIQRCCAPEPESRPTMDDVMQEMENWKIR